MSVIFNPACTVTSRWTPFKALVLPKVLSIQYDQDTIGYTIWAIDGNSVYTTFIWLGVVPPTDPAYNQAQNDADKADFETNYKTYCNNQILETDLDSRLIHRFGNLTTVATTEVLMANQTYAEPASQAQRSVVSTSAQDAPAGTGAKAVRIVYLDSNYVLKSEDVILNGTTAVNTVAADIRFIERMQVIQGAAAVGAVKLMSTTAGGGTQVIAIGAGTEDTFMCHHYVPAGQRAWILGWGSTIDNNAFLKLKSQQRFGANLVDQNIDLENLFIGATGQPQRSEFYRCFQTPIMVGEKCYIRVTVVPQQSTSTVERSVLDIWEDKA